jgi:hypothetical protein
MNVLKSKFGKDFRCDWEIEIFGGALAGLSCERVRMRGAGLVLGSVVLERLT